MEHRKDFKEQFLYDNMVVKIYIEGKISPEEARTGWLSKEDDHTRRHGSLRSCVDGFLEYEMDGRNGILLAHRDGMPPGPGSIWVPGGEWKRGIMNPLEALALKIKEETNLDITYSEYLGMVSILWEESPYNAIELREERKKRKMGEGIHDIGHIFFAKAKGNLKLKTMNPPIIFVNSGNYEEIMTKYNAHDYIRYFTKEALKRINNHT